MAGRREAAPPGRDETPPAMSRAAEGKTLMAWAEIGFGKYAAKTLPQLALAANFAP